MARAGSPRPAISPATRVTSSSERAQTATAAPAWLKARAMARPTPRLAPVTRATCPSRRTSGRCSRPAIDPSCLPVSPVSPRTSTTQRGRGAQAAV